MNQPRSSKRQFVTFDLKKVLFERICFDSKMSGRRNCIIAVHAGAGYHSKDKERNFKAACTFACKKAMAKLKKGESALEAIQIAIQCLEDSMTTNAGVGSNLTIEGTVECDASIMDGQTLLFGGVGALPNIKNPIQVAGKLVEEQKHGSLPLGRIPPCMMVGEGACNWARQHGIKSLSPNSMKTATSISTFENHKRRLEAFEERKGKKRKCLQVDSADGHPVDGIQDTVGAVCIDGYGNMAAGASSGGISLKQSGRIGPAALYGAGCWAYNWKNEVRPGIAVATTGTGEHIIKTLLAKTCGETLQSEEYPLQALQTTFQEYFLDSDYLDKSMEHYGGAIALKHDKFDADHQTIELLWGHTTDSMCIGYMTSHSKPKAVITRLEEKGKAGFSYLLQGNHFSL